MSSSHKKRQTMAKHTRERAVKEKRERKQEKKDERKQALAMAQSGESPDVPAAEDGAETGDPVGEATPTLQTG
jgi:hypothetical protein